MSICHRALALILLVSLLVVGCGPATATRVPPTAAEIAAAATDTPQPFTATPAPPTATAIPPTPAQTPLPPTATPLPTDTALPPTRTPQPTPTPRPPLSGSGGGVLAFIRTSESGWGIYAINADGSDQRRLRFHAQALAYPEWSPDGSQIAFHKHQSDQVWSINVMDPDGSNEKRLTNTRTQDADPVWSPDGSQIVFARNGDLWVMNADGTDQRQLMDDPVFGCCIDWSPDGSQLAFESERDGNAEIYTVDADGSNQRRLTENEAEDWWPAWSPDSAQIAFMSDRDGDWEIYVMDANGGDLRQLTENSADDREPAWSPDGTRIAFVSSRDSGLPNDSEIYVMEADGTDQQRITEKHGFEWGIDWRPEPAAQPTYLPLFEPADCQFTETPGYEFDCGYLTVPEDRSDPGGATVRLHVAIVRSYNPGPEPDPVIYLTGGGGVDTFDYLPWFLPAFGDAILKDRDLIFFNQRGMHHNDPQLQCPGFPELLQRLAAPGPNGEYIDRQEREAQQAAFFADCYTDLVAQGIKLEMYDSATSAADADDLRAALGYDQVNYYGSSYGTLLGLLIVRDHPQGARSVVLDSVFPPEADYYIEFGRNAYDTFRKLFDGCAADPRCSQQHPDLEEKFLQVVDQLNADPRTTTWDGSQEVMYNGETFIDVIYLFPYIGEPEMAIEAIESAAAGDFSIADGWAPATMDLDSYQIQWGFYRNRDCRDEVPFYSYEDYDALMEGLPPQIVANYRPSLILGLCEGWPVEPAAPIEDQPVFSDVPVLVLSGEIDPITPPRWAQAAAENLRTSYFYVFPGYGHGVTRKSPCALAMMLQFFDDPTQAPDDSCIAGP
jgi:Tol biopolymer transport system component/pimeloyl-ACP methyl ester carboxylesterase